MIAHKAKEAIHKNSAVRKMFEEGLILKKSWGEDQICDFSLGNPDQEPPEAITKSMKRYVLEEQAGRHQYMPNAGYLSIREAIANYESERHGIRVEPDGVIMTVGAAGAINVLLQSLLDPGDEVIILSPYFTEYPRYVENAGGRPILLPCNECFRPDLEALAQAINSKTKAIIINSPNNPSGVVYEEKVLQDIAKILNRSEQDIYVLADEVYRDILYTDLPFPSMLSIFSNAILIYSWSKSYALPGERIGYLCFSPQISDYEELIQAVRFYNRCLGFVNAPAFWQNILSENIGLEVNTEVYRKKRDLFLEIFDEVGISCYPSEGAFYLVPEVPGSLSTEEFVQSCKEEGLLLVDAAGFGLDRNVRISYAVPEDKILLAREKLRKIMDKL